MREWNFELREVTWRFPRGEDTATDIIKISLSSPRTCQMKSLQVKLKKPNSGGNNNDDLTVAHLIFHSGFVIFKAKIFSLFI
jgi:hypothetical protein